MINWSLMLWYFCFSINIISCIVSPMISSPLFLWAFMEINLISFLILIWSGSNSSNKYSIVSAYFISQTLASVLLVLFICVINFNNNLMMFIIIAYKSGMLPFHGWFFYISNKVNSLSFFLVSTTQKIIPVQFFFMIEVESLIMMFISISAIMSSFIIISLNNNVSILIISSCLMMTWMTSASIFSMSITWLFFLMYSAFLGMIISQMNNSHLFSSVSNTSYSEASSIMTLMIIIMYAGIPPSPIFFMKMSVIEYMMLSFYGWASLMLLLSSIISIYSYISLLFNSFQCNSLNWMTIGFYRDDKSVYIMIFICFVSSLSLVMFL